MMQNEKPKIVAEEWETFIEGVHPTLDKKSGQYYSMKCCFYAGATVVTGHVLNSFTDAKIHTAKDTMNNLSQECRDFAIDQVSKEKG